MGWVQLLSPCDHWMRSCEQFICMHSLNENLLVVVTDNIPLTLPYTSWLWFQAASTTGSFIMRSNDSSWGSRAAFSSLTTWLCPLVNGGAADPFDVASFDSEWLLTLVFSIVLYCIGGCTTLIISAKPEYIYIKSAIKRRSVVRLYWNRSRSVCRHSGEIIVRI